jgi:hypothetical protein
MGRSVSAGGLVRDQADFFLPGGNVRAGGIALPQVSMTAFSDNGLLSWPLADGSTVPDSSISAGTVYFSEISGAPGFYSVRFFPDRVGYWRIVLRVDAFQSEVVREYDVNPASAASPNGLNASFLRP